MYIAMAAFAGAVTALSMQKWRSMTAAEIGMGVFVGFTFALFVAPWAVTRFGWGNDMTAVCMFVYVFGSGANIMIPLAIKRLSSVFGTGDEK
jgi:Mg/Co/Ni transporter MgtE